MLVDLTGGQDTLGKDLAMHVAASKPMAVSGSRCRPKSWRRRRRSPRRAPPIRASRRNIVEKMVDGAVAKYLAEVTLLGQPFVKGDGKQTVEQLLKAQGAVVNDFVALCRR